MAKREFLQLAHKLDAKKHGIGGWLYSEKLDGERCFWDGGVSTGLAKSEIPWANTNKDERYVMHLVGSQIIFRGCRWMANCGQVIEDIVSMFIQRLRKSNRMTTSGSK
jgi:hypothetical protein